MSNMSDCRFRHIVTDLSDCEDAIDELFNGVTDEEKGENGYPQVITRPGIGSPALGQYADGHEANTEERVPAVQRLPDGHRSVRTGSVQEPTTRRPR